MIDEYTYRQYLAVYEACNGITTHFIPVVGTSDWHHSKLSYQDFEHKLARQREIESHDDDWWRTRYNYIDEAESEEWESLELRSELFLIELKRYEKIAKALEE